MSESEQKINILKEMIGKTVYVIYGQGWYGEIVNVKDENTFTIKNTVGFINDVSIWDVRSTDYNNEKIL